MTTQLSPQIRVFALVGVLLIALGGGTLVYLQHSKAGAGSVTVATTQRVTTPASTTASTAPTSTTGSKAANTVGSTATTATTPPQTVPATQPANPVKVDSNLPAPLRAALEQQRIVVVSLYNPQVQVDRIAVGEAQAGAAETHVGFLRVNVLDNRVAGTLTALLPAGDLLPNPGFLIYRRPGTLVFRFDGYLDRAAIAQAVQGAK